jgi:hypothetical protein
MDAERQQGQQYKPKILPLSNRPYYLLNDMQPKILKHLQDDGKPEDTIRDWFEQRLITPSGTSHIR